MPRLKTSACPSFVLIVDDSDYSSIPLEIALQCLDGLRVIRASNAKDACKILLDPRLHITALITDLNMPVTSGYELIWAVRASRRYRALPVIAISGEEKAKAGKKALRSGADAFFEKPFSPKELRSTLQRLLRKSPLSTELG